MSIDRYKKLTEATIVVSQKVFDEIREARQLWPLFNSAHEGFAILLEEVDELKTHVWTRQGARDLAEMQKEAIQIAATAMRFATEVCTEEKGRA